MISNIIIVLIVVLLLFGGIFEGKGKKEETEGEKVRRLTGLDLPGFVVVRGRTFGEFNQTVVWKRIRFSESLSDELFMQLEEMVQKGTDGWTREGDWYVFDWHEKEDAAEGGDFLSIKIDKGKKSGKLYVKRS